MFTRCKACNTKFVPRINKLSGEEEDLCSNCLIIAKLSIIDADLEINEDPELLLDFFDLSLDDRDC